MPGRAGVVIVRGERKVYFRIGKSLSIVEGVELHNL